MLGQRETGSWLGAACIATAALLTAATLLPLAETDAWWVRVFDFPRPQVAALLALCAGASAFALERRRVTTWSVLGALLLSLGLQLHRIWPYTPLHPPQAELAAGCAESARISVLTVNLREGNEGAAPFLQAVREADPDVVFVVEVDYRWAEALTALKDCYPESRVHPRDDAWGLAMYSRLPLVDPELQHLLSGYVPSIRTGLRLPSGGVVTFHGLHPKPPLPGKGTGERDAELLLAARIVRREGGGSIVAGDLNDVAWSDTTQLFKRVGGLLDPRVGRGLFATWNANLPAPVRWPIDHIFFTPELRLQELRRLPDVGSDHFPIMATPMSESAGRTGRYRSTRSDGGRAAQGCRTHREGPRGRALKMSYKSVHTDRPSATPSHNVHGPLRACLSPATLRHCTAASGRPPR